MLSFVSNQPRFFPIRYYLPLISLYVTFAWGLVKKFNTTL